MFLFNTNVDSVLGAFNKTIAKLRKVEQQRNAKVIDIRERIMSLEEDEAGHLDEAKRAGVVAAKLEKLLDSVE